MPDDSRSEPDETGRLTRDELVARIAHIRASLARAYDEATERGITVAAANEVDRFLMTERGREVAAAFASIRDPELRARVHDFIVTLAKDASINP